MLKKFWCLGILAFAGCGSTIDDVESEHVRSNVPVEEKDGVVTATAKKDSETLVVASSASGSQEASVGIPAGALSVDTEIEMGDAADDSAAIIQSLSISTTDNAIVQKGSALYVAPTGDPTAVSGNLAISLPLPVESDGFDLTASAGKLVYIYVIYTSDGYRAGIKAMTAANLVGTFVKADFKGFGYFQIAFFAKEVEEVEVAYAKTPALG